MCSTRPSACSSRGFMIPGLVATVVAVFTELVLAKVMF